jgi:dihydrodiol dehydrogenase / D-xylose 1-dehydrogenase (NADP)
MKIRWGILGTGNIANKFAEDLALVSNAELVAVASRTQESADKFADLYNITQRYSSYEKLAEDPNIDVVYISTIHPLHKENSLTCLKNGKAVLCEKPFTLNAKEADELINFARTNKIFLMEAMWNRYLPSLKKLRQLLSENVIGDILQLTADFALRFQFDPKHRLFDPEKGGGALLDLGIYPVSFSSMIFGAPKQIKSFAHLGETGVDEQASIILEFDDGKMATLYTSTRFNSPSEALLIGSTGRIKIHGPIYSPTQITLYQDEKETKMDFSFEGVGLHFEAQEVVNCLKAGKYESEIMPLDESFSIMKTMDQIRKQWGLVYPTEE